MLTRRRCPIRAFGRRRAYPRPCPSGRGRRGERTRTVPTFTAARSTGEASGSTPAASPRLRRSPSPWPPDPESGVPAESSPSLEPDGCAPPTSPHPPDWSWFHLKRRNEADFLRIPSRLAHRARPIRQCWTVATLSRLLPPFLAIPRLGYLQLYSAATTPLKWTVFHLHPEITAAPRGAHQPGPPIRRLGSPDAGRGPPDRLLEEP